MKDISITIFNFLIKIMLLVIYVVIASKLPNTFTLFLIWIRLYLRIRVRNYTKNFFKTDIVTRPDDCPFTLVQSQLH